MQAMTFDSARVRIQIHFIEMPGLRLTLEQASRLCGVATEICSEALDALVRSGFLSRVADGSFVRCGLHRADVSAA